MLPSGAMETGRTGGNCRESLQVVGPADDFCKGRFFAALRMTERFEGASGKERIEVIHISLQVLSVVEANGVGTDHRLQGVRCVW